MKQEISSGGIIVFGNTILLLRKYNGDWVLPKGKVEDGESMMQAAIREVYEEAGVKAKVEEYIGKINYKFKNSRNREETVMKTVHWYLMSTKNMNANPQKEEGFIEAKFVHMDRVEELLKYDDEKKIIKEAIVAIS